MSEEIKKIGEVVENMSEEEITKLQEKVRKIKGARYRKSGIYLRGYIPMKYTQNFELVLEWLVDYEHIKKPTKNPENIIYNFTSYAARVVIEEVLKNIREIGEKPRTP